MLEHAILWLPLEKHHTCQALSLASFSNKVPKHGTMSFAEDCQQGLMFASKTKTPAKNNMESKQGVPQKEFPLNMYSFVFRKSEV